MTRRKKLHQGVFPQSNQLFGLIPRHLCVAVMHCFHCFHTLSSWCHARPWHSFQWVHFAETSLHIFFRVRCAFPTTFLSFWLTCVSQIILSAPLVVIIEGNVIETLHCLKPLHSIFDVTQSPSRKSVLWGPKVHYPSVSTCVYEISLNPVLRRQVTDVSSKVWLGRLVFDKL